MTTTAFDITKKRAIEQANIDLVDGDGSPLLDDKGNQLSVTVHGPASKVWQAANAERNRKRAERLRKNGGRAEAMLDNAKDDAVEFLCRITVSFNGWDYEGKSDAAAIRAAYEDDALGFIRDHVMAEACDWSAFTKGSAKN